jgi:hypothetical protein
MELDLVEAGGATSLRLRVKPNARANAILGARAGSLRVSVTAAPERGRANEAAVRLVAETLGLAPSALILVAGHASRDKLLRVPLSRAALLERLASRFG